MRTLLRRFLAVPPTWAPALVAASAGCLVAAALACGERPPRTVVSSSASTVSDAEGAVPAPAARRDEARASGDDDATAAETDGEEAGSDTAAAGTDDGESRERRGGDLIVRSPADTPTGAADGARFRRQVEGALAVGSPRTWVGPDVPPFVDVHEGSLELTTLDATADGYLATYRDPVGAASCPGPASPAPCAVRIVLYAPSGKTLWTYDVNDFLARKRGLEVRDLHYGSPYLYVNQSCAPGAVRDGACDRLIAIDTRTSKEVWRSDAGTSSGPFVIGDSVLVTTVRRASAGEVVVLSRTAGHEIGRRRINVVPAAIDLDSEGNVQVEDQGHQTARLQLSEGGRLSAPAAGPSKTRPASDRGRSTPP